MRLRFEPGDMRVSTSAALPHISLGVRVTAQPEGTGLRGVTLHTQVQIEPAARAYTAVERERLRELFGDEIQWPGSLRSVVWTRVTTQLGAFQRTCVAEVELPCGADLELVANKYCFGIEGGEVPLRLLFSGSILYGDPQLQITPIGLDSELSLRLPLSLLREAIAQQHTQQMLIGLRRDVFERLYRYRRLHSLPNWEHVVERLLEGADVPEQGA